MKSTRWLLLLIIAIYSINTIAIAAPTTAICEKLNGSWRSDILGQLVTFECTSNNNPIIASYYRTPSSYVLQQDPAILSDDNLNEITFLKKDKIRIANNIYFRTNEHPYSKPSPPGSAFENCKILTEDFQQHYGNFNLRNVEFKEWQKQCNAAIDLDPYSIDFYNLIITMLNQFNDNHIMLSKNIENDTPDYFGFSLREPFASNLKAEVKHYNNGHGETLSESDYVDHVLTPQVRQYLSSKISVVHNDDNMNLFWGTVKSNPDIVYLYLQSMEIENIDALNDILNEMISFIKDHKISGVIIDARFNQGGDDLIGRIIMSHFIDKTKIAYWKQTFYNGDSWTLPKSFLVEPADEHITTTPIALLVSPLTASAAESFSLAMLSLPQVKLFGDNTMGIFSDQFPRKLPNGWWITLSNEKMLSANDKISYEKVGLPVFERTGFPFLTHLNENGDAGIKAAVNYINNSKNNSTP